MKTVDRIVWIEDSQDIVATFKWMLDGGFKRDNVSLEIRRDFDQLRDELDGTKPLAKVYIFDNEILGEREEGSKMAQRVQAYAQETGQEVVVITLLCSNPEGVEREHGHALREKGIPILHKNCEMPIMGFYIGHCLDSGKTIPFTEWCNDNGIRMDRSNIALDYLREIQSAFNLVMEDNMGGFYQRPSDFIASHEQELKNLIRVPEARIFLEKTYPIRPPEPGRIS